MMSMWEEKDKTCKECHHKGYCIRKYETMQGKYCLSYNTINLYHSNWCKGLSK